MPPKRGIDLPDLIAIRLDREMRKGLENMAKQEERPMGAMARILLREAMEARKKGRKKPTA